MSNEELILLAEKVEKGLADNQELLLYAYICESYQQQGSGNEIQEDELQQMELEGLARFWLRHKRKSSLRNLWPRIAAAAAILLIVTTGAWWYMDHYRFSRGGTADIAAGKQAATLTLANGRKIRLTDKADGELAEESGVSINKTASGQVTYEIKEVKGDAGNKYNTISTANGETYTITLPDRSRVWLNAASSLRYPLGFSHGERKVELSGEGYFEIAADAGSPFIVESMNQRVVVLGTHFDISSYADDNIVRTTLLEGAVKVNNIILKPDQQAIVSDGATKVIDVDGDDYVAWKDGEFRFSNDEHISSVMKKLARWYDIDVEYVGNMDGVNFTGTLSRSKNIASLLHTMEQTGMVKFEITGRKVIVKSTK